MSDLRTMATDLGLRDARTFIATGNLLFETESTDMADLERRLEAAFEARFGRHVDVIVRDAPGWKRLVAGNPFPKASGSEPAKVSVRVMRNPLDPEIPGTLEAYRAEEERMALVDGDLWLHLPHGVAGSRLAAAIKPHRAGGAGTFRNWNTVRRLGEMLQG